MNRLIIFDFNRTLYDPDVRVIMPGATQLLQTARDKGYVAVLLARAAASRADLIAELRLAEFFAETHLVEHKSRALFDQIAERHGADPHSSLVIGDRAQGEIAIGAGGGWRTIWLKSGRFAGELPYPDRTPTYTISKLSEALTLI